MDNARNSYVEHLVKRKDPSYWTLLKILSYVLAAAGLLISMSTAFGFLLLLAAAALVYVIHLFSSVEYEYLYIEGSFSVDEVLNRSRRRKLVDTGKDELILAAPQNSDAVKEEMRNGGKLTDLSGNCDANRKYVYICQQKGQKKYLLIEMTDELLRDMRYYSPSKVKTQ